MFGSLGNLTGVLKAAKELQGNLARLQGELAARRYEADAGGGAVLVVVDGRSTVVDVRIDPSAAQDVELLEDLVKSAVNAATGKAQEAFRSDMTGLTGGMNIPGLTDLVGGGPG